MVFCVNNELQTLSATKLVKWKTTSNHQEGRPSKMVHEFNNQLMTIFDAQHSSTIDTQEEIAQF